MNPSKMHPFQHFYTQHQDSIHTAFIGLAYAGISISDVDHLVKIGAGLVTIGYTLWKFWKETRK
jgi:hypothetical protein